MKALSVRQPWAWLLVHGFKDVENRSWKTRVRGTVAIHASRQIDRDAIGFVRHHYPDIPLPDSLDTGMVVGTVDIAECVEASDSPWFSGPHGFRCDNPRPCEPIRSIGQLGFFEIGEPELVFVEQAERLDLEK